MIGKAFEFNIALAYAPTVPNPVPSARMLNGVVPTFNLFPVVPRKSVTFWKNEYVPVVRGSCFITQRCIGCTIDA